MKYRCNTPSCSAYHNYGGKGVKVCDEWNNVENGFINFYNWAMDNGYKDNLTIDRIDSNGNYEPNNCRWVTKSKNTAYGNIKTVRRKANNGTYYGISPTNEYYKFDNASDFARQHNLNDSLLRDMANKIKYKNSKYKGWIFGFVKDLK